MSSKRQRQFEEIMIDSEESTKRVRHNTSRKKGVRRSARSVTPVTPTLRTGLGVGWGRGRQYDLDLFESWDITSVQVSVVFDSSVSKPLIDQLSSFSLFDSLKH